MACSSVCPTQDHRTFGECLRAKGLRVAFCGQGGLDATRQKAWDADISAYRKARSEGIQPSGTDRTAVDRAFQISDKTGQAFVA